jgi:hypothetical protein
MQTIRVNPKEQRDLLIIFPDDSVTNKTYDIVHEAAEGKARASWSITKSDSHISYPAENGKVTITMDEEKGTVSGSFSFEACSSTDSESIHISDGKFMLSGIENKKKNRSK